MHCFEGIIHLQEVDSVRMRSLQFAYSRTKGNKGTLPI